MEFDKEIIIKIKKLCLGKPLSLPKKDRCTLGEEKCNGRERGGVNSVCCLDSELDLQSLLIIEIPMYIHLHSYSDIITKETFHHEALLPQSMKIRTTM